MTVLRGRHGETVAVVGVPSARGVGRGAIVGVRPPLPPLGGRPTQCAAVFPHSATAATTRLETMAMPPHGDKIA